MTDDMRQNDVNSGASGLGAWVAVAVRQSQELWRRGRNDPQRTTLWHVVEQLTTIERLLPVDDSDRASIVPWLGILLETGLQCQPDADPRLRDAALRHLRWTDHTLPLDDRLALRARICLADLLIPDSVPQEARDGSGPQAQALTESLREDLTEAMTVLDRIIAGDHAMREPAVDLMESITGMLSSLTDPSAVGSPSPPQELAAWKAAVGDEVERTDASEVGQPSETNTLAPATTPNGGAQAEGMADAVQDLVALASQDATRFTGLLGWLCVALDLPHVPAEEATEELAVLGLGSPVLAPLREPLIRIRSGGGDPRALAASLGRATEAAGRALRALPPDTPERSRVAKLHAALMLRANLLRPGMMDFAEVDAAIFQPDPDSAARTAWGGKVSLELLLTTAIDRLWVGTGEFRRVEHSIAWFWERLHAIPEDAAGATAVRQHLAEHILGLIVYAEAFGGSLQDSAAALAMVRELRSAFYRDDSSPSGMPGLLALCAARLEMALADRSADYSMLPRVVEELSGLYASLPLDDYSRVDVAAALGQFHKKRAARTGDPADLRLATQYFREAVEIDPRTAPPLLARSAPGMRAFMTIELAMIEPSREAIDRAVAEVRRSTEGSNVPLYEEGLLRFALGKALLQAARHLGDPSLLDPCLAELTRAHELTAAGCYSTSHASILTALANAYWASAATGGPRASEDRKTSLDACRQALTEMAADVLLQLGAEHSLSVARAASAQSLWLALRCAELRRPAEAVEALELGRTLVLQTAATSQGMPELLATRGFPDLAEQWRAAAPEAPPSVGDPPPQSDTVLLPTLAAGRQLPSSLRRQAFAALGAGRGAGARELLGTPDVAELGAGVAASGADALVYLVPGEGFRPHVPGRAMILRSGVVAPDVLKLPLLLSPGSRQLENYLRVAADRSRAATDSAVSEASRAALEEEWRAALDDLCDWAWPAAVEPVLASLEPLDRAPRIVLVPCGPLGVVPWHAARQTILLSGHRYACQDAVFSYAPSGAHFLRATARDRLPATGRRVLVADPELSLVWAEIETEALRAACYPDALRYGEFPTADDAPDASGTCDDLLAVLPGGERPAAIVHVSCHGVAGPSPTRSALSLADGELTVARILDRAAAAPPGTAGPLVVLSACETDLSTRDHDEALTLSTALVARGAADVVGSRWAVNDSATAVMMAVFHHFLTTQGLAPADALRAAQLWMLDPDRQPPPTLRGPLDREATRTDLHQIHLWAAFTHQGNPASSPFPGP